MSEDSFVFPSAARSDVLQVLDELGESQPDQWLAAGPIFVRLVNEDSGLYLDWEPEVVASLEQTLGHRPAWGVQIQYRPSLRLNMVSLVVALMRLGGVAVDDVSSHIWTSAEVAADLTVAGSRFGESPAARTK